jgi:hypothetical protein
MVKNVREMDDKELEKLLLGIEDKKSGKSSNKEIEQFRINVRVGFADLLEDAHDKGLPFEVVYLELSDALRLAFALNFEKNLNIAANSLPDESQGKLLKKYGKEKDCTPDYIG